MSAVGTDIPNVAIPHTETDYCNTDRIVVVKLENEIPFHNMITPKKQLNVKFAFFILNGKKSAQTNILSSLMESFTQNWDLKTLSQFNTEKDIFQYIQSKTEKGSV
ncbi:PTS sugar transporter subunit IIA [Bacillus sonorensis]|nr:PTS sugar transporter subunit IIA [Bacillus sonorensis]